MTGTGTQTDPYIIENWADFFNITDSAAYYKLGCNLDANDYNNGIWTACTLSCKELDGDYHEIRNVNNISTSDNRNAFNITSNCNIKNLDLKQCVQTTTTSTAYGFFDVASGVTVEHDNCNYEINAPYIYQFKSSSACNFAKSVLSFKGICITSSSAYQKLSVEYCNIHLEMSAGHGKTGFARLVSSSVLGNLNSTAASTITFEFGTSTGAVSNSVIALKSNSGLNIKGTTAAPTVVDTAICTTVSGAGVIAATTEQMQDADWLNANGFAVISV